MCRDSTKFPNYKVSRSLCTGQQRNAHPHPGCTERPLLHPPPLHTCTKGNSHALNRGIYCLWVSLVQSHISYSFGEPLYWRGGRSTFCATKATMRSKHRGSTQRSTILSMSAFTSTTPKQPKGTREERSDGKYRKMNLTRIKDIP